MGSHLTFLSPYQILQQLLRILEPNSSQIYLLSPIHNATVISYSEYSTNFTFFPFYTSPPLIYLIATRETSLIISNKGPTMNGIFVNGIICPPAPNLSSALNCTSGKTGCSRWPCTPNHLPTLTFSSLLLCFQPLSCSSQDTPGFFVLSQLHMCGFLFMEHSSHTISTYFPLCFNFCSSWDLNAFSGNGE